MNKGYNECLRKVDKIIKHKPISSNDLLKVIGDYIELEKENLKCYSIKNFKYREQIIGLKILYKIIDEEAFKYSSKMKNNKSYGMFKAEVKTRLMMMFIKSINEITCMLENGFCSCALSKIRYMYEISVFMDIIENNDENLSKKFFYYSENSRLKLAKYIKDINIKEEIENRFNEKDIEIKGDYNWASDIFINKDNKKPIHFSNLVEITKLKQFYHIYKLSCLYTHADIFGSMTSIDRHNYEDTYTWITTPSEEGTRVVYEYIEVLTKSVIDNYFEKSKEGLFIFIVFSKIFDLKVLDK